MRVIPISLVVLSLSSTLCHATASANIDSIQCAGSQTSSFSGALSLTCSGDFSLIGGSISADSKILISSAGTLALDNLSITAPEVEFIAGSFLSLGAGVSITTNSIYAGIGNGSTPTLVLPGATISIDGEVGRPLNSGSIRLLPGGSHPITSGGSDGSITILPSVPELDTYVTMLAGLLVLVGALRVKNKQHNQRVERDARNAGFGLCECLLRAPFTRSVNSPS